MITKCANPACSVPFRYLHEGQLYRFERVAQRDTGLLLGFDANLHKHSRGVEFYWLCKRCAASMKLIYCHGIGVTTHPRYPLLKSAS